MSKRAKVSKPEKGGKLKKTATGYKFPEHIPSGLVIKDTKKQEWCIHDTIGTGGFGEIYSASKVNVTSKLNASHPYAVKVEPKENGPLYVEMHFYMRVAKAEDIEAWKKKKGLKSFGMPVLHGSGSFEYNSNSYRFLVTDKLGRNLQDILKENNNKFPHFTVLQIGIQVINILEYIHNKGYIHGDIKSANMMLGIHPGTENTVYVIDFGLAAKCGTSDKEFNKDPKKAHNGTIEYISRDGHTGVFGFRGDLEILGYNLIHWLTGSLPWVKDIANPAIVEQKKIEFMKNPAAYVKKQFPEVSEELVEYMEYIGSLKNNDIPDYEHCKNIFIKKLCEFKYPSPYGKLIFTDSKTISKPQSPSKRKQVTPKTKLNKKNVSQSSSTNSPSTLKTKQGARKRKSPAVINENEKELNAKDDESDAEVLQNKKPRKKNVRGEIEKPVSSTSKDCSYDEENDVNNESGLSDPEGEDESAVKRKNRTSRRSSIKFTVRKKSPIKGRLKKLKAKENMQSGKDVISLDESVHGQATPKNAKKTVRGKKNKANDENKPSWRDAPAVIASNVKVPGEYIKSGPKTKKNK